VAYGHGGDLRLVPYAVGERRLKLATVDGLRLGHRLARGHVHDIAAVRLEEPGDLDRIAGFGAAGRPVHGRDTHRDRLVRWPHRAHRVEYFQGKPHPVSERSAVLVLATVRERRDET